MIPRIVVAPDRDVRDARPLFSREIGDKRALNGRGSGGRPIPLRDRIIANTTVDENGCWIWDLTVNELGYPTMMVGAWYAGKVTCQKAYRIAYLEFVGEIPDGLELDHVCRVPRCCNPAHLEPVTHRENTRRGDQGQWQKDKTHCPKGHPYSGDNLVVRASDPNHRRCRICEQARHRVNQRNYLKRKEAKENALVSQDRTEIAGPASAARVLAVRGREGPEPLQASPEEVSETRTVLTPRAGAVRVAHPKDAA